METKGACREQFAEISPLATTAEHYRKVLFGDRTGKSMEDLLHSLSSQTILDIASGLNHLNRESLIRRVHQYNKTVPPDKKIHIFGVEPKLHHPVGEPMGFKQEEIEQAKQGHEADESFDEADYLIPETAEQMHSVPDESTDKILCHLFVSNYAEDESRLLSVFEEFNRVLKPEGEIRVYPLHDGDEYMFDNKSTPLGTFITEHFTIRFFRPAEIQTSENRTMVLVKKAKE